MNELDNIRNSGMLEQYVLGLLSKKDADKVEAYIQQYPELQQHVREIEEVMEMVLQENSIQPPSHLKDQVLSSVDQSTPPTKVVRNNAFNFSPMPILAAAAAIGLVILSFSFFTRNSDLSAQYASLENRYEDLQAACQKEQAIAQSERALLMDVTTENVILNAAQPGNTSALFAIVHYNEERGEVLLQNINLPEPPDKKQYQMWADVEGEMVNMGVVDLTPNAIQKMTFVAHAESINITLEPLGGSEEATVATLQASGKV
ncbi:MAG: anti-sigma factor [Bacteroidota bacterium]